MTELHELRLQSVIDKILGSRAKTVLDLGCGQGDLITALAQHDVIEKIVGLDISATDLVLAREKLNFQKNLNGPDIELIHGSFDTVNSKLVGFDAAIMLETIEHIEPKYLSRIEHAVFNVYQPKMIVITTPNVEYNPLHGLEAGQTRHVDHKFEWTRAQFKNWCEGVAKRCNYLVGLDSIGNVDPILGGSTQLATFHHID